MRKLFTTSILSLALAAPFVCSPSIASGSEPAAAMPARTPGSTWATVATQSLAAGGAPFAYRELGKDNGGTPVVLLGHLAAVLDNWDPRVVDGIAARRHVIVFDNRGVGASGGAPAHSIEQMADDAITFIKALGFTQVDLFGFSMGGMVAQEIALKDTQLVRKMILAGTGPAGTEDLAAVAGIANYDMLRGALTSQDPKQFLFFTRTPNGIAAGKAFLARLQERSQDRDQEIAIAAYIAQLQALRDWGRKAPADLAAIRQPVLVVNGDNDRMVPTVNTRVLARRLPNSHLVIYPDAGHGGVFQYHEQFVPAALEFLAQ